MTRSGIGKTYPSAFDVGNVKPQKMLFLIHRELILQQAMEENLLCPFYYFGISELQIDGQVIDNQTEFRYLVSEKRVDHIIEQAKFYGYSGNRVRGLVFCSINAEASKRALLL